MKKWLKLFFYTLLAFSLILLIIFNFKFAWILSLIFSLLIFAISMVFLGRKANDSEASSNSESFPIASFVASIICLVFILANSSIGGAISKRLNINFVEIRTPVSWSLSVGGKSVLANPIFGAGPGRFFEEWEKFKPSEANQTSLWKYSFETGFGLIPTLAMMSGFLGIISWVAFFVYFLLFGFKKMISREKEASFFPAFSFSASIILWVFSIMYVPKLPILFLAFLCSGFFIGSMIQKKYIKNYEIFFLKDPRQNFFCILGIMIVVFSSVAALSIHTQKFVSGYVFNKGISVFNSGDYISAESYLQRASVLSPEDFYFRNMASFYLARLDSVLSDKSDNLEVIKSQAQDYVLKAESSAKMAISEDGRNHLNWLSLGQVYSSFIQLSIPKSYDNAMSSYEKALKLSPKNPLIYYLMANASILNHDLDKAKGYLNSALELKGNFVEASNLLLKIQANEVIPSDNKGKK